jgi:hypothetical protein
MLIARGKLRQEYWNFQANTLVRQNCSQNKNKDKNTHTHTTYDSSIIIKYDDKNTKNLTIAIICTFIFMNLEILECLLRLPFNICVI